MWLACRKYHPTFGIPGTEIQGTTVQEQVVELGRGWEWWPSVFWQVIWTWIVSPWSIEKGGPQLTMIAGGTDPDLASLEHS